MIHRIDRISETLTAPLELLNIPQKTIAGLCGFRWHDPRL